MTLSEQPTTMDELVYSLSALARTSPTRIILTPRTISQRGMASKHRDVWLAAEAQIIAMYSSINLTETSPGIEITPRISQTDRYYIDNDPENITRNLEAIIVNIAERTR